jgi:hypothetical protein
MMFERRSNMRALVLILVFSFVACGGGGTASGPVDAMDMSGIEIVFDTLSGAEMGFDAEGSFEFQSCMKGTDCLSGFCVETPSGEYVCAPLCVGDEECPEGWQCKQVLNVSGDVTFICLPLVERLCRPCKSHEECRPSGVLTNDLCVNFGDDLGSFCGQDCSKNEQCPNGYSCFEVSGPGGQTAKQCLPDSGECICSTYFASQGFETTCKRANGFGSCLGIRKCVISGQSPSACDAKTPTAEECNGADEDCDGVIDEEGANGCTTYYIDADGDGYGDTEVSKCLCAPLAPFTATNGGDCDDSSASVHPDAVEVCANGKDDDCDGQTDEAGCQGCTTYYRDEDGDSYGVTGDVQCLGNPTAPYTATRDGDCDDNDATANPAASESCNGKDDNCNGQTDEGIQRQCQTMCGTGKEVCVAGVWQDCDAPKPIECMDYQRCKTEPMCVSTCPSAPQETCNGKDDDCDGLTDEDNVCGTVYKIGINPDDGAGTGACGCSNICEDNINLAMGLYLRDFLVADTQNANGGGAFQVFMTRTDNSNPSLASRADYLNSLGLDRTISISCNADPDGCATSTVGTETYIKSTSDTVAYNMARKVNAQVATHFQTQDRGVKLGNYYMLAHTTMPHIFVFVGFLTNQDEAQKLNTQSWQREASRGMLHGIQEHLGYQEFDP